MLHQELYQQGKALINLQEHKRRQKQKSNQIELSTKIEATNKAYKESISATGKNSEASKKLATELNNLKESYAKNENAIESQGKKIDNSKIKYNNLQKELLQTKSDMKENETALKSNGKAFEANGEKAKGLSTNIGGAKVKFLELNRFLY